MKKLKFALGVAFSIVCSGTYATSLLGITSDGGSNTYQIGEVRSIKIAPKKDGANGYSIIKFNDALTGFATENSGQIAAYPNPVSEYLQVSEVDDTEVLTVSDSNGKEIRRSQGNTVNVSDIPAGIYVLTVKGHQIKFIKK